MDRRKYKQIRAVVAVFISMIVSVATTQDSYLLAAAGVLTGMVFLVFVRSKAKIKVDEREIAVSEKAARITYSIFASTIGLASFLLLLPSKGGLAIFSKGEWLFVEAIGMVLAYLTLFLIALYALSYYLINRKYGGGDEE